MRDLIWIVLALLLFLAWVGFYIMKQRCCGSWQRMPRRWSRKWRLLVEDDTKKGLIDLDFAVVFDEA